MKRISSIFILLIIMLVSGCDFSSRGASPEVTKEQEENKLAQDYENDEEKSLKETEMNEESKNQSESESKVTASDSSVTENIDVINFNQYEKSEVRYVKDIEPNELAKDIEQNSNNYTEAMNSSDEQILQQFDIDEDGNKEQISVMFDNRISGEETRYILVISDYKGNPKYADYQYNAETPDSGFDILTVAELTGDNMMEIVLEAKSGITAYFGAGYQSLSHLTYGFDAYKGNFTKLPVLGAYYNVEWDENFSVNVDEEITGFNNHYSYVEAIGGDVEDTLRSVGIISDTSTYEPGTKLPTTHRTVSAERAIQSSEEMLHFDLISKEVISHMRIATLMATNVYRWNTEYNWLEPINSTLRNQGHEERKYESEKEVFNINNFNAKYKADNREIKDFLGQWQLNINGKLQNKYLEISQDTIIETEEYIYNLEETIETSVSINDYIYKSETGQLITVGEVNTSSDNNYDTSYGNQFIIMEVDGENMLMDKYGYFYIKQDS